MQAWDARGRHLVYCACRSGGRGLRVWHFVPKRQPRAPKPSPRYRQDPRLARESAEWRALVEEHCESPAEVDFVRAMIAAHGLTPFEGSLINGELRLDFQVGEGRYRTDFLVKDWLVVEIDGAAYHSSPEAVARDAVRDRYFEDLGYSVLRIPAKVVFQAPQDAVSRVDKALSRGRRVIPPPPPTPQTDGFTRLGQTAGAIGDFLDETSAAITAQRLMEPVELAAAEDRKAIEAALYCARSEIERDEDIAQMTAEDQALLAEAMQDWDDLFAASEPKARPERPGVRFQPPPPSSNEAVNARARSRFDHLAQEREDLLRTTRQAIEVDPRLVPLMQKVLSDIGRDDLWPHVR